MDAVSRRTRWAARSWGFEGASKREGVSAARRALEIRVLASLLAQNFIPFITVSLYNFVEKKIKAHECALPHSNRHHWILDLKHYILVLVYCRHASTKERREQEFNKTISISSDCCPMRQVLEWVVHAADSRERKGCMGLMGTRAEGLGGIRGGGGVAHSSTVLYFTRRRILIVESLSPSDGSFLHSWFENKALIPLRCW